MVAFYKGRDG